VAPDLILLKRAVLAFRSGEKQTARDLLVEACEHNPDNELVWLWRASAARTRHEAYEAVVRVLDLNPDNEKARVWIEKLRPSPSPVPVEAHREEASSVEETVASANGRPTLAEAPEEATARLAELEEESRDEDEPAEEEARAEEESAWRPAEQAEVAAAPHQDQDEAEARLAALEADLDTDRASQAPAEEGEREIIGYGWGADEDTASEESGAQFETDDRRVGEEESDSDPLMALLDEGRKDVPETHEKPAAAVEPPAAKPAPPEEDVWASLGMAGMDAPAKPKAPLGRGAAAGVPEFVSEDRVLEAEPQVAKVAPTATVETEQYPTCFVCEKYAQPQEGYCSACRAIVDLQLLDLAPRHEGADRNQLTAALDRLRDKIDDKPSAELYVQAALVSLNLRQSQQALAYLQDAIRLRPHDQQLVDYHDKLEKRPLILAVDDSKTVQKMISTVLEKEAYRVIQAEDGLGAIAKLDEAMPNLILLDITMPRMDGYQVCKVITGNDATKHIPVIMLSGKDGFFDKVRGKMVGASNYITKPFDPADLARTIAKFLKN
jgi:twitching motility two-component system response regulator PilG